MAQLAILGHATRDKEVIEILEMLGDVNYNCYRGDRTDLFYIENTPHHRVIDCFPTVLNVYNVFSLEEFLEKFPYKVGDKVQYTRGIGTITSMKWNVVDDEIQYNVNVDDETWLTTTDFLLPYKEQEIMEEKKTIQVYKAEVISFSDAQNNEYVLDLADKFEIVIKEGKYFAVKKKPKYPKTYDECCNMLDYESYRQKVTGYDAELIENLQTLKLCRDAYWKIAGDWKPKWNDNKTDKYIITNFKNEIVKDLAFKAEKNSILAFPTEEMRDAFYENFKELIEEVKELL